MAKSIEYRTELTKYLFSNTVDTIFSGGVIDKWILAIHETANNPLDVITAKNVLDQALWLYGANAKAYTFVSGWTPINSWKDGAANSERIDFPFVPVGETWTISYITVWVQGANATVPTCHSAHALVTPVTLTELQVFAIDAGNYIIQDL
jgi:hypothetical protein